MTLSNIKKYFLGVKTVMSFRRLFLIVLLGEDTSPWVSCTPTRDPVRVFTTLYPRPFLRVMFTTSKL